MADHIMTMAALRINQPDSPLEVSSGFKLKVTIHNHHVTNDQGKILTSIDAEMLATSFIAPHFKVIHSSVHKGNWIPKTLSVELNLHVDQQKGLEAAEAELKHEWYENVVSKSNRHFWLETDYVPQDEDAFASAKHRAAMCQISFGTFPSADKYCQHWHSEIFAPDSRSYRAGESDSETELVEDLRHQHPEKANMIAEFEHDMQTVSIRYVDSIGERYKLEIAYDQLEQFVLLTTKESTHHLYFFMKNQPKVYKKIPQKRLRVTDNAASQEERVVRFGTCGKEVLGSSNVLHLAINDQEIRILKQIKSRLSKQGFTFMFSNPFVCMNEERRALIELWPLFKEFRSSFALFCLLSRGFKVTDQIDEGFLSIVKTAINDPHVEAILSSVTRAFDRSCICSLQETFQEERENFKQRDLTFQNDEELQIPEMVKVRCILVTPTTSRGLGEEWTKKKKVPTATLR